MIVPVGEYVVGIREGIDGDWFESVIRFSNYKQASTCLKKWEQRFVALYGNAPLSIFYRNTRIMKVRK